MDKTAKHDPPDKEKKRKKEKKEKSDKSKDDEDASPRTKTKKESPDREKGALSPKADPAVRDGESYKSHRKKSISGVDPAVSATSAPLPIPGAAANLPPSSSSPASGAPWLQAQPLPVIAAAIANGNGSGGSGRRSLEYARPPVSVGGGLAASDRSADKPRKSVAVAEPPSVLTLPIESTSPPLTVLRDSKAASRQAEPSVAAVAAAPGSRSAAGSIAGGGTSKAAAGAASSLSLGDYPLLLTGSSGDSPLRSSAAKDKLPGLAIPPTAAAALLHSSRSPLAEPSLLGPSRTRERAASMSALGSATDWTPDDRPAAAVRSSDEADNFAGGLGSSPEPSISDDQPLHGLGGDASLADLRDSASGGGSAASTPSSRSGPRTSGGGASAKFEGDLERLRREEAQLRLQKEAMKQQMESLRKEKDDLFKKAKGDFRREAKQSKADSGTDSDDNNSEMQRLKLEKRKLKMAEEKLMREEHELRKKARQGIKQAEASIKKEKEKLRLEKEVALRKVKEELKRVQEQRKRSSKPASGADVLMSGWIKMRGSPIRNWHMRWFVLKPGKLIYYTGEREKDCTGIILLRGCRVLVRPSKKVGYCFKIFHPRQHPIYSAKGLKGETLASGIVPVSVDHCILRVNSDAERNRWIAAVELAIKQAKGIKTPEEMLEEGCEPGGNEELLDLDAIRAEDMLLLGEDDMDHDSSDDDRPLSDNEQRPEPPDADDNRDPGRVVRVREPRVRPVRETRYVPVVVEDSDLPFNHTTQEELASESKGLLLMLIKQVRPGMDLSKVVLPTFILEPRSMLEKLSDFFTHVDLLALVPRIDHPLQRLIGVVKWYLSGFYLKPKGVKKPYNPIVGEFFRCKYQHRDAAGEVSSETFFVAEQVSHHPPVSAFYASNRKEGFVVNGSILFRTKFMGTYAASILDGFATIHIIPFNEEYEITFPSAHGKGFLFGTLTMEMVGLVQVLCRKTGYRAEVDFKAKPLIGGSHNVVEAKIKHEDKTLYTVRGKWDGRLELKNYESEEVSVLWQPTEELYFARPPRLKPAYDEMGEFESDRLWEKVGAAIKAGDQQTATDEKAVLELAQRQNAKQRERDGVTWDPQLFKPNKDGIWIYRWFDKSQWNPEIERREYELGGVIRTQISDDQSSEEESEGESSSSAESHPDDLPPDLPGGRPLAYSSAGDGTVSPTAAAADGGIVIGPSGGREQERPRGSPFSRSASTTATAESAPRGRFVESKTLDDYRLAIDGRLLQAEKKIVALYHRLPPPAPGSNVAAGRLHHNGQRQPPTPALQWLSERQWLLFLIVAFVLFYTFRLQTRLAQLEDELRLLRRDAPG